MESVWVEGALQREEVCDVLLLKNRCDKTKKKSSCLATAFSHLGPGKVTRDEIGS